MSGVSMTSGVTDLLGPRAAQAQRAAETKPTQPKAAEKATSADAAQRAGGNARPMALRRPGVTTSAESVNGLTPEARATVRRVDAAAQAFEQIFVKKLLESAHFGPKGQHGSMGIDALARGVTSGGGLGLGHMIRDTLLAAEHPELAQAMRGRPMASQLHSMRATPPGETADGAPIGGAQEKDA